MDNDLNDITAEQAHNFLKALGLVATSLVKQEREGIPLSSEDRRQVRDARQKIRDLMRSNNPAINQFASELLARLSGLDA